MCVSEVIVIEIDSIHTSRTCRAIKVIMGYHRWVFYSITYDRPGRVITSITSGTPRDNITAHITRTHPCPARRKKGDSRQPSKGTNPPGKNRRRHRQMSPKQKQRPDKKAKQSKDKPRAKESGVPTVCLYVCMYSKKGKKMMMSLTNQHNSPK